MPTDRNLIISSVDLPSVQVSGGENGPSKIAGSLHKAWHQIGMQAIVADVRHSEVACRPVTSGKMSAAPSAIRTNTIGMRHGRGPSPVRLISAYSDRI